MGISVNRKTITVILALGVAIGLAAFRGTSPVFSDPPWPTPPPAVPSGVVYAEEMIRVISTPAINSSSVVLHPIWGGHLPRIPPLRSLTFSSHQGIDVVMEAGSLLQTMQLVYSPVDMGEAPSTNRYWHLLKPFDLLAYDHRAEKLSLSLVRPWILEVRLEELELSQVDMSQLLIGRFDLEAEEWIPMVTFHYSSDGLLVSKILDVGRFAIMSETHISSLGLQATAIP